MRKQTGCLVKRAGWWLLRYRMRVMEGGELRSVNRALKLCRVDSEHKTKASVRDMARDFLKPVNDSSKEQQPTSRLSEFVENVYLHLLSGIYRFAMQQGLFERANPVTAASIPDAPGPSETYAYSLEEVTQSFCAA